MTTRTNEVIAACVADTERRQAEWRARECTPRSHSKRDKAQAAAMSAHFAGRKVVCTGGISFGDDIVVRVTKIDPYGKPEGAPISHVYQPDSTGTYRFVFTR